MSSYIDLTDLHRLQESPVKQRKNKNPDTSSNVTTDLNDQKNVDVAAFSPLVASLLNFFRYFIT